MTTKRIVWTNPDGTVSVLVPAPGVPERVWRKDVPQNVQVFEATTDDIPQDRLFRKAWRLAGGKCTECPVASKEVAHEIRRARREAEFAPHDEAIAKRIPGAEATAEAARRAIRNKYADVQAHIDACATVEELRRVVKAL